MLLPMLHHKMVKLTNKRTGAPIWVADERVDEYKAAGYIPADTPKAKPIEEDKPVKRGKRG